MVCRDRLGVNALALRQERPQVARPETDVPSVSQGRLRTFWPSAELGRRRQMAASQQISETPDAQKHGDQDREEYRHRK